MTPQQSRLRFPDYIEERITRQVPLDACIVPGSTPVISFGEATTARVATLGLNPSRREFDPVCRLAKSERSAGEVLHKCNTYFSRIPYLNWFSKFDHILEAFGTRFNDGSACHLVLVQWATDPTWNGLSPALKSRLISDDARFLDMQLRNCRNLRVLLVNGSGVLRELCRNLEVEDLRHVASISGMSHHPTRLYSGHLFGRLKVLGWSTNLQSSHGVKKNLWETALPEQLKAM